MDLFTIQCTTCNARLAVRDESVVGDILACPKCNSMVQVVPPPGWKRPGTSGETSNADSSLGDLSASKIPPIPSAASAAPSQRVAAAVPPALPARKPEPTAEASPQPVAKEVPTDVVTADSAPGDVEPAPVTPSGFAALVGGVRKDWLVLGGGLVAGVMLGAVAWLVVWLQTSPPGPAVAQAPATQPAASQPEAVEVASTAEAPAPAEPASSEAAPAATKTKPLAAENPQLTPPETPPAEVAPKSDEESEPAAVAPSTEAPTAEVAAAKEAKSPTAAPAPPAPALKLEPIAANNSLPLGDEPTAEPSLTESASADTEPVESDSGTDPSDEFLVQDSPGESAPRASAQIQERLAVPLAEVQFARVPLAQFAAFVGDVTGVRVVLDEESLKAAGKNRKTPIQVRLSNTTALATLQAASQQAGLSYRVEEGRIVISAAGR